MEVNKIHNLDCLNGMKHLEDNSVDLIVTDPPYGYSFMGKNWDKAVPKINIWEECLRVLKDGALSLFNCCILFLYLLFSFLKISLENLLILSLLCYLRYV